MLEFGFSYIGVLWLLMLFVPNILWAKRKPSGYEKYASDENKVLGIFERIGEVLTTIMAVCFKGNNVRIGSVWLVWLVLSFVFMVIYEIYWIRYFRSSRTMADMYSSCLGVPVAGATCPVIAFFLLGIYGSNILLIVASVILGIGHIGIHLGHRKEATGKIERRPVIQKILVALCVILLIPVIACISIRNYIWVTDPSTIRESLYTEIGGQQQYFLIRGTSSDNPVILYLHGGPGSPDACMSHVFTDYLIDDYTVVCWDQRGCGRTYLANDDTSNSTVSFDNAMSDLGEVISWLQQRYGQEKIILMGHSYGSVLGAEYTYEHPENIEAFIGIGQFVNWKASSIAEYEEAYKRAAAAGDETVSMTSCYDLMVEADSFEASMAMSRITGKYLTASRNSNTILDALLSPYMGSDDFMWTTHILSYESFMEYEGPLMDYLNSIDLREDIPSFEVPVLFISGGCDYNCTYTVAEEYARSCGAEMYVIDGAGHYCHAAAPSEFACAVKDFLMEE